MDGEAVRTKRVALPSQAETDRFRAWAKSEDEASEWVFYACNYADEARRYRAELEHATNALNWLAERPDAGPARERAREAVLRARIALGEPPAPPASVPGETRETCDATVEDGDGEPGGTVTERCRRPRGHADAHQSENVAWPLASPRCQPGTRGGERG